jgi:hypothetical protein
MINEFLIDDDLPTTGAALFDVDRIEALVRASAAKRAAMSYSELLLVLGYRFTRPKMRALCKVLDVVDQRALACGEPELAALVVREGDGLPGQGWWVGRNDYQGEWTGPTARRYLDGIQTKAFDYWEARQS